MAITKKSRKDPREDIFLGFFFTEGVTQGLIKESAVAAGYAEDKAEAVGERILAAFDKKPASDSLNAAGVTKPYIALKVKRVLDAVDDNPRYAAPAIRLALMVHGETRDGASGGQTTVIAGQGAQILVVQGATADRMKRLKAGASGQPAIPEDTPPSDG